MPNGVEMFQPAGETVIVTGGARGIGRAIAKALGALGLHVAILDLDSEAAHRTAGEIMSTGGRALAILADLSNEEHTQRAIEAARERLGSVHVLINNAGVLWKPGKSRVPFSELPTDIWDFVHQINVNGAFYCSRAVIPDMIARGEGRIVNMASMAVRTGGSGRNAPYTTSKGALVGLTKALARELGPYNITVNAVAPGIIETAMLEQSVPADEREGLLASIPLGRFGTPQDVASVVSFLVSQGAGYLSGATIDINGGMIMG